MNNTNIPLLDNREAISQIDANHALQSIEEIGSQITQIWQEVKKISLDSSYQDITTVVVAGMGGSVLGTDVVKTLFNDQLKVPVIVAPGYTVPAFVNHQTLVIVSSYSGNTEETFSAAQDALAKGAKLLGITTGGKIADFFSAHNLPILVYDPIYNPSKIAHMGLGYSIFGQMALFAKAGLISLEEEDYQQVLAAIANTHLKASVGVTQERNLAKVFAFNVINKIPVVTVAEHLEGAAHVFSNLLNEVAKTFAEYRVVPELNHHLMEGLQFPESSDAVLEFITFHSSLYHKQNQLRMQLTEEVIDRNGLEFLSHHMESTTKIGQVFEFITLGAYSAFYLAMLNDQNPVLLPNVDWFKAELSKRSA
jgi:glucose/mannose-6-phosphate isomerase